MPWAACASIAGRVMCASSRTWCVACRRSYSEEVIGLETIESELADAILAPEPEAAANGHAANDISLTDAVDRHLQAMFAAHGDRLPPDGMYDRIISEVERPASLPGPGGNTR